MRSFAIVIRRAYFEAKNRRKYAKNVVVNRSGFGEQRKILLGRRGHYYQGDREINALFSGIKRAQTPPPPLGGLSL